MDRRKDMISVLNSMSGKYSSYEVFSDFIRCSALAIANSVYMVHGKLWRDRENAYLDTMKRYNKQEQAKFAELFAMLTETLEAGEDDVLGDIFMKAGMGSSATGQFFTPFHLSVLSAELGLESQISEYKQLPEEKRHEWKITLNEPACGGGAMIIATAKVLKNAGINYQRHMKVVAQDLDWKGVYMAYLQLSLLGINAVVIQGDTLCDPYIPNKTDPSHILFTPAAMGVLL